MWCSSVLKHLSAPEDIANNGDGMTEKMELLSSQWERLSLSSEICLFVCILYLEWEVQNRP